MLTALLQEFKIWTWKRKYRPEQVLTRFLAKDIRRDVEIIDVTEIERGLITGRTRTWNVLYARNGLREGAAFGEVRQLEIEHLWEWKGELWGGPVPDSIDEA